MSSTPFYESSEASDSPEDDAAGGVAVAAEEAAPFATAAENDYAAETAQFEAPPWRTDTLAESLAILMVLSIVQRLIGFIRQVLVCRWLEPSELGQWDIAFKFLMLAAPMAVLGLPGSFGRYTEYYRRRGHLRTLLRRTAIACALLACGTALAMIAMRQWISELIYGADNQTGMVTLLAVSLLAVIAYNYLTEMLTALRMVRVASVVQLLSAIAFALLSVGLVFGWRCDASAVVIAYALSCLLLVGPTWIWFRRAWRSIPEPALSLAPIGLWGKLIPFALSIWAVNLLYNLVGVVDRYMIIHYSPSADPLALVGHYHSAQVVPMLMVSLTGLLGGILLPYLSHDWEMGDREAVGTKLNLAIKLLGMTMLAGGTIVLLGAPLLFGLALHGKYDGGLQILPWTLTYCAWMALISVAQMYLWCAERARLPCFALVAGLIVNVVLCRLLLPGHGLFGVVWATAAANLLTLAILFRFNKWFGMRIDRGTWLVALLPAVVTAGPLVAVVAVAAVSLEVVAGHRLISRDEKQQIIAAYRHHLQKIFPRRKRPEPS